MRDAATAAGGRGHGRSVTCGGSEPTLPRHATVSDDGDDAKARRAHPCPEPNNAEKIVITCNFGPCGIAAGEMIWRFADEIGHMPRCAPHALGPLRRHTADRAYGHERVTQLTRHGHSDTQFDMRRSVPTAIRRCQASDVPFNQCLSLPPHVAVARRSAVLSTRMRPPHSAVARRSAVPRLIQSSGSTAPDLISM